MNEMLKKARQNFFTGLIVVLPIIGSFFILSWAFIKLTNFVISYFPQHFLSNQAMRILSRSIALVLMVGCFIVVGWFAKNFIGRRIVMWWEGVFKKIPFFNRIYVALKQISEAFWGDENPIFEKAVMIEYPRKGIYAIAFVTSSSKGEVQVKTPLEVLNLFVPTTPNPTSGVFILVPSEDVVSLTMTVEEAMKLVISGGAVSPEYILLGDEKED